MKKQTTIWVALLLTITLVLSGCNLIGGNKNGESKADRNDSKGTETSKATGNETSGTGVIIEDTKKWPVNDMGNLEKPNAVVDGFLKDSVSGVCIVTLSELKENDAEQYLASLKTKGYNPEMEVKDNDGIYFLGKNSEGESVIFTYNPTGIEGTVSFLPKGATTGDVSDIGDTSEVIDMTDASPWPKDFLAGVPELQGKITNVANSNDETVDVYLDYVTKEDAENYIKTLKQKGYTVDSDEFKDTYNIDFSAYNENGDYVDFSYNIEYKSAQVYMEIAATE